VPDFQIGSILKWKFPASLLVAALIFFLLWKVCDLPLALCVAVGVVVPLLIFYYLRRPFWEWLFDLLCWW